MSVLHVQGFCDGVSSFRGPGVGYEQIHAP